MSCWSKGMAANITPDSPPSRKKMMNPQMNSSGVLNSGRPVLSVVIHANSWIPLGTTMIRLAAAK